MTANRGYIPATGERSTLGVHSLDRFVLAVPDLAPAQRFYADFGLEAEAAGDALVLRTAGDEHPWGLLVEGTINRLFDRGAIVDVGEGIEGFVPLSQLGIDDLKRPNDAFEIGEKLTMKVTRVDVPNHRLILSVKAWLSDQDDIALAEWTSKRNQVRARIAAAPPREAAEDGDEGGKGKGQRRSEPEDEDLEA